MLKGYDIPSISAQLASAVHTPSVVLCGYTYLSSNINIIMWRVYAVSYAQSTLSDTIHLTGAMRFLYL
jgi:hypothetical protein